MSFIQSDNVETHERDFQWTEQPRDGKTVTEKCVATPGPLGTTCKNDAASFSDVCSDKTHWSYSKCDKPKAPEEGLRRKFLLIMELVPLVEAQAKIPLKWASTLTYSRLVLPLETFLAWRASGL